MPTDIIDSLIQLRRSYSEKISSYGYSNDARHYHYVCGIRWASQKLESLIDNLSGLSRTARVMESPMIVTDATTKVACTAKKFWMVALDNGISPTKRHDTYESARTELTRLVAKANIQGYILEAREVCEPIANVQWKAL